MVLGTPGFVIPGEFIQVRDDAGQDVRHTGAVEPDVFRLGVGLRNQIGS